MHFFFKLLGTSTFLLLTSISKLTNISLISFYIIFLCKTFWYKNQSTCCFLQFTRLIKYLPTLHGVNWKSFQNRLYNFYSSSLGLDIAVSCKMVILIFRITFDNDNLMRYRFFEFQVQCERIQSINHQKKMIMNYENINQYHYSNL